MNKGHLLFSELQRFKLDLLQNEMNSDDGTLSHVDSVQSSLTLDD